MLFCKSTVFECYILDDGSLWKSNIIPWQWVFISPYVPQVIFQNLFTHLDWNWFRVDYYCDWNWLTVIIDFVSRVARHCKVSSILEIWSYNKSAIAHLTYNDVIRDINQVKTRWAKSVWCETVYIKQICLWHKNIVNSRSLQYVHCIELLLCDDFHFTLCHSLFNG